jgi:hypothetical protein
MKILIQSSDKGVTLDTDYTDMNENNAFITVAYLELAKKHILESIDEHYKKKRSEKNECRNGIK